jgi:hypothetical protein
MKKFYMTMVAMLCGAAAMAQTCTISADDVIATAGGETAYVEVILNESEPGTLITAAAFRIQLPAGVAIATYYDEDEEADVQDISFPNAKKGHDTRVIETNNPNEYQISVASNKDYFKTSTNVLAKIGIAVPAGFEKGDYLLKFSKISFANAAGQSVYPQDDFTAKLIVQGTGINDINAIDSKAPIYNVAGQRVNKAQKGVYIQNGKKVAVK